MQIGFISLRMVCALVGIIGNTFPQSLTFRSRDFGEKSFAFINSVWVMLVIFYFIMPKPILKINK